jgi:hypothetical protein
MSDDVAAVVGQLDVAGTYVLTSAERSQVALALPDENHTAFTGRMLRLLQKRPGRWAEYLTIDDVYAHLVAQMKSEGSVAAPEASGGQCGAHRASAEQAVRRDGSQEPRRAL